MKSVEYLKSKNVNFKILHLKGIPKTAKDVEQIYNCKLHQVLKTIIFIGDSEPVMAVLPGDKKVSTDKLKEITKQNLRMAKPEEVREITGYNIGGVSPFGVAITKIIDESSFNSSPLNTGSGTPEIGLEFSPEELKKAWDGIIADIIE